MAGSVGCCFVSSKTQWSWIIPGLETIFSFLIFMMAVTGILIYIVGTNCGFFSVFKIPTLIHIILFLCEIINTWYFESDTFIFFGSGSQQISDTTALVTSGIAIEGHDTKNKPWWFIYRKHYFVTTLKWIGIITEIVYMGIYAQCPWSDPH